MLALGDIVYSDHGGAKPLSLAGLSPDQEVPIEIPVVSLALCRLTLYGFSPEPFPAGIEMTVRFRAAAMEELVNPSTLHLLDLC